MGAWCSIAPVCRAPDLNTWGWPADMPVHRWNEIAKEQINPRFVRQMIHTETMTIARMELGRGALVPEHAHHNEQVTTLERGRMRFVVGGVELILQPGE